jgi:hypothetical protein
MCSHSADQKEAGRYLRHSKHVPQTHNALPCHRAPACPSLSGAWCVTEPDSCLPGASPAPAATDWDYCPAATTLAGCSCAKKYTYEGATFYGTCNNLDNDAKGSWCIVEPGSCPSAARAHGPGSSADYDYCQARTRAGCFCSNSWSFAGVTYNGTCRTGVCATAAAGRKGDHCSCHKLPCMETVNHYELRLFKTLAGHGACW